MKNCIEPSREDKTRDDKWLEQKVMNEVKQGQRLVRVGKDHKWMNKLHSFKENGKSETGI